MEVIDLTEEHMPFVGHCTHIDDSNEEIKRVAGVRERWLQDAMAGGLRVKVAMDSGQPVGFAHCLPIELGAPGMSGADLMTVPCLTLKYDRVYAEKRGSGYGRALMEAVEAEARKEKKGVAVLAYDHDFWFMPASFFRRLGYRQVAREGSAVIMLKGFEPVRPPVIHRPNYRPEPVPGRVAVDAFWHPICMTAIVEIHRVREVCAEYGERVLLREFNCGDKRVLERYQTSRALFINGEPRAWGYEAPRDELRREIERALESMPWR
jgi:GNAT superfamily N-acetyltransferase